MEHGAWADELRFWRRWFETRGDEWPEEYARRMQPDSQVVDPMILGCLRKLGRPRVSLLDVGSGPITNVGYKHPDHALDITAVDPLAEPYARLMAELGVDPPVRTITGTGEALLERFPPGSFDIVFSSNALDHGTDPVLSINNMYEVARPGGFVALRHMAREGEHQGYHGLHAWNFDERDGDLVVWARDGEPRDITSPLRAQGAEILCDRDGRTVNCAIRKAL